MIDRNIFMNESWSENMSEDKSQTEQPYVDMHQVKFDLWYSFLIF